MSFTSDQLLSVEYFSDAVNLLDEHHMLTDTDRKNLNGFGHLSGQYDCKKWLLHIPFLIIEYSFEPGIDGKPFSEIHLVTVTHQKWRMRDSSKGIHTQLIQIHEQRTAENHPYPFNNVWVPRGLSVNAYNYTSVHGLDIAAKTYSLDFGT